MTAASNRTRTRWLVAAGAAIVIAGSSATFAVAASADTPTPTAQELITAIQQPTVSSLAGTVVTRGNLGLPKVPSGIADVGPFTLNDDEVSAQVWVDGEQRQRVSIGEGDNELTVIRNGDSAWLWSAPEGRAVQLTGDSDPTKRMELPGTPADIAREFATATDATTALAVNSGGTVTNRSVYELVLDPKDEQTMVDQIVVAVDTETYVPLQVQVFSTEISEPALQSSFTTIDFSTPASNTFEFTPPEGAEVTERQVQSDGEKPERDTEVIGDGWSAVMVGEVDMADAMSSLTTEGMTTTDPQVREAVTEALVTYMSLPTVSGDWGSGRLIEGTLFSAIITDDGRYAVGTVPSQALTDALSE